jgi:hypothetical protein
MYRVKGVYQVTTPFNQMYFCDLPQDIQKVVAGRNFCRAFHIYASARHLQNNLTGILSGRRGISNYENIKKLNHTGRKENKFDNFTYNTNEFSITFENYAPYFWYAIKGVKIITSESAYVSFHDLPFIVRQCITGKRFRYAYNKWRFPRLLPDKLTNVLENNKMLIKNKQSFTNKKTKQ